MELLSDFKTNPKTKKLLDKWGYEGGILHLASADSVSETLGRYVTVCPMARRNKCDQPCLDHQGRGRFSNVIGARVRKTALYFEDRKEFDRILDKDLKSLVKRAAKRGSKGLARLDGTSDLGLAMRVSPDHPDITFYDYTKVTARYMRWLRGSFPNYHLTYSLGAGNKADALKVLREGGNVAVVFRARKGDPLPAYWEGFDVIDGDEHDFRFRDPVGGYAIGLRSKGSSYYDRSGFVQEVC
jgi:hypothetical protein